MTQTTPIKQAAILLEDEIWTLPRPARHHHIVWAIEDVRSGKSPEYRFGALIQARGEQGFIDENGLFLNRPSAAIRARQHGQLTKELIAPPNLFSEDLW